MATCILILSNAPGAERRTRRAYQEWLKDKGTPIIVSGNTCGITGKGAPVSEYQKNLDLLAEFEVPKENILVEENALDTTANFILSRAIIDLIGAKKVKVVSDEYHLHPRAQWLGQFVLGPNYKIESCSTKYNADFFERSKERFLLRALQIDFFLKGIHAGDKRAFQNYLQNDHPFYAEHPSRTAYGTLAKLGQSQILKVNLSEYVKSS